MSEAPVRLDHIAIALPRLTDASPVLVGALGGVFESGSPSRGFTWACWRYEGGGRVEVLEPRGEDGFLHRFLARQPAGIHHVTFKVASLTEACDRARGRGYEIVGYDDSRPGWAEAFLHPRQALGIVVQLAESRPAERLERRPAWTPPANPGTPPAPVTIVGLRLRARSAERPASSGPRSWAARRSRARARSSIAGRGRPCGSRWTSIRRPRPARKARSPSSSRARGR